MAGPAFFSQEWADAVRDALIAGPSAEAKSEKLQMYRDFFDFIKSLYPASWALGCRDLPPELGRALRPHLKALRDEIDTLTTAIHRHNTAG